jgi:hypothetical protein
MRRLGGGTRLEATPRGSGRGGDRGDHERQAQGVRCDHPGAPDRRGGIRNRPRCGGDLRVRLPVPSTFGNRTLTCERIDRTDHEVVLEPLGRSLRSLDGELRLFVVNGAWQALGD